MKRHIRKRLGIPKVCSREFIDKVKRMKQSGFSEFRAIEIAKREFDKRIS